MGHAVRMVNLVRQLSLPAIFTSWGEGREYIVKEGYCALEVPSVDVEWSDLGRMAVKKSVSKLPRNLCSLANQVRMERKLMHFTKPSIVISDSRLSAIIAAHTTGLPSILVTNQLRIAMPLETSLMQPILERAVAEALGPIWSLANEIVAPDLPPPYTISEKTLLGLASLRGRIKFLGFFETRPKVEEAEIERARMILNVEGKLVYAQISGPRPTRKWLLLQLLAAAPMIKGATLAISVGEPGKRGIVKSKNVRLLYWNEMFDATVAASDLLVSRGGHSTIAKGILAGKPMVLVPIPYHGEQMSNSKKAESLGLAKFLDPVRLTPSRLADAISHALENGQMESRAAELSAIASKFDSFKLMGDLITLHSNIYPAPRATLQAPSLS